MLAGAVLRQKSPEAFRTISEVSDELDVPQHVLRFWESRFAQVRPVKRAGGRRYYRPEDVDLLRGIRALLYSDGYTIRGVQKILKDRGLRHVADIGRGEVKAAAPIVRAVELPAPEREVIEEQTIAEVEREVAKDSAVATSGALELTHARAAIALVERAHAEVDEPARLPLTDEQRAKLEFLLAELLNLKKRLVAAKG